MTEDELAKRAANLNKLPVTTPETIANSAYKASETKPVLEKVELKPTPELDASVSLLDLIRANIELFWRQNIAKYFGGEEISNPLSFVSVLTNWKAVLIGLAVLGVLFVLLRWIV